MAMFLLNVVVAIGLIYLGTIIGSVSIANFIASHSEEEILAKIREIKNGGMN